MRPNTQVIIREETERSYTLVSTRFSQIEMRSRNQPNLSADFERSITIAGNALAVCQRNLPAFRWSETQDLVLAKKLFDEQLKLVSSMLDQIENA